MKRHGEWTAEDFWTCVDRSGGPTACWPWLRSVTKLGYGQLNRLQFGRGQRPTRAHRVAFYFTHGYWPNVCRHTCDNPPCCNPAHLLDGTHADNVADKHARGRYRSMATINAGKSHCPAGHPYDEANTRLSKGRRHCRECDRIRSRIQSIRLLARHVAHDFRDDDFDRERRVDKMMRLLEDIAS